MITTHPIHITKNLYLQIALTSYMRRIWKLMVVIVVAIFITILTLPRPEPFIVMGIAYMLFIPGYALYQYNERATNPLFQHLFAKSTYTFTENGFSREMGLRGTQTYEWGQFTKIAKSGAYYLLYQGKTFTHVVPVVAFQSPADEAAFQVLVQGLLPS